MDEDCYDSTLPNGCYLIIGRSLRGIFDRELDDQQRVMILLEAIHYKPRMIIERHFVQLARGFPRPSRERSPYMKYRTFRISPTIPPEMAVACPGGSPN